MYDLIWTVSQLLPSKHAGSDPEAFWLWPVMTITASVQPASARMVYARSDFPHPFMFRFSKEGMESYCTKPTRVRSGWPGQNLAKHIWSGSKPVCRNHRARFLAGRNRPATSFPLSRLGSVLPQTTRVILCKISPDPI